MLFVAAIVRPGEPWPRNDKRRYDTPIIGPSDTAHSRLSIRRTADVTHFSIYS
jgi:hypothetical protein